MLPMPWKTSCLWGFMIERQIDDCLEASFHIPAKCSVALSFPFILCDVFSISTIDVAEHFTLNQSRAEDITLAVDYESNLLLCDRNFGERS